MADFAGKNGCTKREASRILTALVGLLPHVESRFDY